MIVCLCRAKNERDVLFAIEEGAETVEDLQECGIGGDCGGCHNSLRAMLTPVAASCHPMFGSRPCTVALCAEEVA